MRPPEDADLALNVQTVRSRRVHDCQVSVSRNFEKCCAGRDEESEEEKEDDELEEEISSSTDV
jgi:hypothetical protein